MAVAERKGKRQRSNSKVGRLRKPNLDAYYNRHISSIEPGDFEFRVVLVLPEKPEADRYLGLNRTNTSLEWGDENGSILTGSLTVRRPAPDAVEALPIARGHRVRLFLWWGGRWRRLWDMRITEPPETNLATGEITCQLEDDLNPLAQNIQEWDFKKDKQHPQGWTADEITRFVCRETHVRPGKIAEGTRKIKKLKLKGSGLEVIRKAWAMEKAKTLKRYVIRFRDTRLDVLPFGRPSTLYVISGIAKQATDTAQGKTKRPVTSIKAKGRIKVDGKDKKVEEVVRSHNAIARFGFSEQTHDYGRVDSRAELREEAKRDLAEAIKVTRTAQLIIPGIPFLEKGSTLRWLTDEPGWQGKVEGTKQDRSIAFVAHAHHSLQPTSYETDLELSQDDPYFSDRQRRDEERRNDKKKQRSARKPKQKAAA